MKQHTRISKTAAFRLLFVALAMWGGLAASASAQTTKLIPKVPADKNNPPSVRVVIPDVKMCPGEEYDLPIYLEIDQEDLVIPALQLLVNFPDYDVLEPAYDPKDVVTQNGTKTVAVLFTNRAPSVNPTGLYNITQNKNFPAHTMAFGFYASTYTPKEGVPMCCIRVRCKQQASATVSVDTSRAKYSDVWVATTNAASNLSVKNLYADAAHVMPAPDPEVSIINDTMMCVNETIRFWADGGVRYEWEDVSAMERPFLPAMIDNRSQTPLFTPQEPGYYTYRCKITNRMGCSAYDTVQCLVLNNLLNLEAAADTMVQPGTPADLGATVWGAFAPPYTLSWTPANLVQTPDMTIPAVGPTQKLRVDNQSLPLTKSQWFTARLNDGYCKLETVRNVNVYGSDVEGYMQMNPSRFCVYETIDETVRLSVRVHGGSGDYTYNWGVENLEPQKPAPVFETVQTEPEARLRFHSRCVVYVDITDFEARKQTRIIDTLRFDEVTMPKVEIVDLNGPSSCEQTEMRFEAKSEHAGDNPRYGWFINRTEVLHSTDSVFSTYQLKPGDELYCELTSDKLCVQNVKVKSNVINPNVVYPGYMTVMPSFGSEAVNKTCGDSLALGILHRNTGKRFRLRWYRNDVEVMSDRYVEHEQMTGNNDVMDYTNVARVGYHDYFRAVVTESDRACLLDDSIVTMAMYPRLEPMWLVEAGDIYVHPEDRGSVCSGHPFVVSAPDVRYLPSQFRLVWYVKRAGEAPMAKGYYATTGFTDNAAYGRNLGSSSEFSASDDYYRTQNWILKGFPVSLTTEGLAGYNNGEADLQDGDSVFYRVETFATRCVPSHSATSACVGVNIETSLAEVPQSLLYMSPAPPVSQFCEGTEFKFFPHPSYYSRQKEVSYTWFLNGMNMSELYPEKLSGDTISMAVKNNDLVMLRATTSHRCMKLGVSRISETRSRISGMYDGFAKITARDTMVCADEPVTLWAVGIPYKSPARQNSGTAPGVPSWLPDYEGKIKVEWAESRADAVAGRFIHTGIRFETSVDSARFGDRSADLYKDSAVVGTQTFVARITSTTGCVGYDSIRVTVGYNRTPSVVVVPEPAFPWCESDENAHFKLEGEFWGQKPVMVLRVGEDHWQNWKEVSNPDSIPYIAGQHKRGAPVQAVIYSSILRCGIHPRETFSEEIPLDLRTQTMAWLLQEDGIPKSELNPAVCVGDELKVGSFGATMEELQNLAQRPLDEIVAQLKDGYEYQWTDKATGAVVSTVETLAVVPDGAAVYELSVQDTAHRCPAVQTEVKVRTAVETGIDFSFSDAFTGKEIPFSICEGSGATEMTWRAHPQNFSGKAYIGFAIMTAESNYKKTRQSWTVRNPDTAITAWFLPGDRVVYGYFHDTLSCSGAPFILDSIDLQVGRPKSESFRGAPDMLLCKNETKRLFVLNAKDDIDSLPAGAPSLKRYLLENGVPGASELPDDGSSSGYLSPNAPLIYWWPLDGFVDKSEQTSLTPEVSPGDKAMYVLWAYNEYGCIQSDSVRVERFDNNKELTFDLLLSSDSVLCDSDDMFFSLDRYESSILTMFDSLVWKRVPAGGTQAEILAKGREIYYLHVDVAHGDTVYVEGYVTGDNSQCVEVDAAWYTSNKIAVQRYERPVLTLAQVETEACADSTLELRATADAAFVEWLRVEGPDKGYEVLERGPANDKTAWARVRTYRDFTARATAYNHPACAAFDSVTVAVAQSLDTLSISLASPQVVCDGVPVTIEVAERHFVDSWQWRLNGEYLTFDDFESEAMMQDFMLGTLGSFSGPFKDGDRIWAEGYTNSRCVRTPFVLSDTVTVERSVTPVLTWMAPDEVAENPAVRRLEACADEELPLRLHVAKAEAFAAVWQIDGTRTELPFETVQSDATGTVYELTTVYPAATAMLSVGAINAGCVAKDSLQIVGHARDTLMLEVESSVTSVCLGEEVHYGIVRYAGLDSVVWYVNGQIVSTGAIDATRIYAYRPEPNDRVWVVGYNTTGYCVYNNGLRSDEINVEVTTNATLGVVLATLTASADSVCGAGAPVYTVSGRGFDSVYWYANGELAAITDLLEAGVRAVPTDRTATWRRAPRPADEGLDSVYAVAVRRAKICALRNEQTTNVVSVRRREKPEVRITPRDTSVLTGYDLLLEGTGASAYVWWTDLEHGIAGTMGTFTLVGNGDTVMVYTMGYEPAFNRDSLAGGQTPAPAFNAYGEFTCLAFDSVLVRPAEIPVLDSSVIYIPNAVLLNSARPADRVFRVYGENIASVHMRIFNNNGDLVFEKTDANPVWRAADVMPGNFTYRIVITMNNGKTVNRNGWISVLE